LAMLATLASPGHATPPATQIVRWSPLDGHGALARDLRTRTVSGTCTDIGYTYVGGIGYRCSRKNTLYDACFREGTSPTDAVICIARPWGRDTIRLRSPHLLQYPGLPFEPASTRPWAIVLADGNRCLVAQGAHDGFTVRGRYGVVDYTCGRGNVVLLRDGMSRGRTWHVDGARWDPGRMRYALLGRRAVRRVYFGRVPAPQERQRRLAASARWAAVAIVRRRFPGARPDLAWVRMALPRADWAYVILADARAVHHGWFVLLQRSGASWRDASGRRRY